VPIEKASEIALLAKQRGAGLLQITDAIMPNPYKTLPNDGYMQSLMNIIEGG